MSRAVNRSARVPGRIARGALLALLVATVAHAADGPAPSPSPAAAAALPAYVGVAKCAPCHEAETKLWRGSHHDHAMEPATPATVRGDELRLRELILNLVDNAVKYSHPRGKVEIDLRVEGATARLAVRDYGIGIPQDAHKQIFDRFFRTDDARAHTKKGTGLGLAICAWIAEAHHGHIDVQSEVGKGSTFTLVLPLAPAAA